MSIGFDREVAAVVPYAPPVDLRDIPGTRAMLAAAAAAAPAFEPGPSVVVEGALAPGIAGSPDTEVLVVSPANRAATPAPALLWFHGGGFVLGDASDGIPLLAAAAETLGIVTVSPCTGGALSRPD